MGKEVEFVRKAGIELLTNSLKQRTGKACTVVKAVKMLLNHC